MKARVLTTAAVLAVLLNSPVLFAADRHYKVQNGPEHFYYGHVSLVDSVPGGRVPVVLREGAPVPEEAVVNLPLGPGDTVRTAGGSRCELQFDTGTVIRLDADTELRIETVLARSLSGNDRLSNLFLAKGLIYVMYKQYDRSEMFQILSPNAAVKLRHNTVAVIKAGEGATDVQVSTGKASVLFGPEETALRQKDVGKMKRLIVLGDGAQESSCIEGTDFELWNKDVNARFEELHEGLSALPKPVQKLPEAVFYFAQTYGNRYGEWLWDDLYGYVWRPYLNNDTYPWGWGPYIYGQWSVVNGQMFWVPGEPWGWIPYHLGIWQWDKKLGWVWLPGSLFASAQCQWDFYFGYASWRPRTLLDFMNWTLFDGFAHWNEPWFQDYYYGWFFNGAGSGLDHPYDALTEGAHPSPGGSSSFQAVLNKVSLRQLKKPAGSSNTMPKELKGAFQRVVTALKQGDARILDSLGGAPDQVVVVRKEDLNAPDIQARRVAMDQVPRLNIPRAEGLEAGGAHSVRAQREAVRIFRGNRADPRAAPAVAQPRPDVMRPGAEQNPPVGRSGAREAGVSPASPPKTGLRNPAGQSPRPTPRTSVPPGSAGRRAFLDWNPDFRAARAIGVHIEYSSADNEVRCPELNLRSSSVTRSATQGPSLGSGASGSGPTGSSSGSSSGGASSSGGVSSQGQGRSSGGDGGGSRSGGNGGSGGGGGKIKN